MKDLENIFRILILGFGKFISIFGLMITAFILLLALIPNQNNNLEYIYYTIPIGILSSYILINNLKKCKKIFMISEFLLISGVIVFSFMETDIVEKIIKDKDTLEESMDKLLYIGENYSELFIQNLTENYIEYIIIFIIISIFYYFRYFFCKKHN